MNNEEATDDELWDYYSGLPNPKWYQAEVETELEDKLGYSHLDYICQGNEIINCKKKYMNNEEVIKTQKELIELLENQVIDLTMMSKIELGDDVIAEIKRLNNLLDEQTR